MARALLETLEEIPRLAREREEHTSGPKGRIVGRAYVRAKARV